MTQVITAAEARLLLGGKKALPASPVERKPATPPKEPRQEPAPRTAQEKQDTTPPIASPTHFYIGPYQLTTANGTHYPGRARLVLVGPATEGLAQAVASAVEVFHQTTLNPS